MAAVLSRNLGAHRCADGNRKYIFLIFSRGLKIHQAFGFTIIDCHESQ
jgi:hypothetical protein